MNDVKKINLKKVKLAILFGAFSFYYANFSCNSFKISAEELYKSAKHELYKSVEHKEIEDEDMTCYEKVDIAYLKDSATGELKSLEVLKHKLSGVTILVDDYSENSQFEVAIRPCEKGGKITQLSHALEHLLVGGVKFCYGELGDLDVAARTCPTHMFFTLGMNKFGCEKNFTLILDVLKRIVDGFDLNKDEIAKEIYFETGLVANSSDCDDDQGPYCGGRVYNEVLRKKSKKEEFLGRYSDIFYGDNDFDRLGRNAVEQIKKIKFEDLENLRERIKSNPQNIMIVVPRKNYKEYLKKLESEFLCKLNNASDINGTVQCKNNRIGKQVKSFENSEKGTDSELGFVFSTIATPSDLQQKNSTQNKKMEYSIEEKDFKDDYDVFCWTENRGFRFDDAARTCFLEIRDAVDIFVKYALPKGVLINRFDLQAGCSLDFEKKFSKDPQTGQFIDKDFVKFLKDRNFEVLMNSHGIKVTVLYRDANINNPYLQLHISLMPSYYAEKELDEFISEQNLVNLSKEILNMCYCDFEKLFLKNIKQNSNTSFDFAKGFAALNNPLAEELLPIEEMLDGRKVIVSDLDDLISKSFAGSKQVLKDLLDREHPDKIKVLKPKVQRLEELKDYCLSYPSFNFTFDIENSSKENLDKLKKPIYCYFFRSALKNILVGELMREGHIYDFSDFSFCIRPFEEGSKFCLLMDLQDRIKKSGEVTNDLRNKVIRTALEDKFSSYGKNEKSRQQFVESITKNIELCLEDEKNFIEEGIKNVKKSLDSFGIEKNSNENVKQIEELEKDLKVLCSRERECSAVLTEFKSSGGVLFKNFAEDFINSVKFVRDYDVRIDDFDSK